MALGNDSNHDVGHRFTRQRHRFVVLNGTPQAVLCPRLLVAFGHQKTPSAGSMVNFPLVHGGFLSYLGSWAPIFRLGISGKWKALLRVLGSFSMIFF